MKIPEFGYSKILAKKKIDKTQEYYSPQNFAHIPYGIADSNQFVDPDTNQIIPPKLATEELTGSANLLDYSINSSLNVSTIPGLRSRNNPVIPPSTNSSVIQLKVLFKGLEGIAKLRKIMADFQASFCHILRCAPIEKMIELSKEAGTDVEENIRQAELLNKIAIKNKDAQTNIKAHPTIEKMETAVPRKIKFIGLVKKVQSVADEYNGNPSFVEIEYVDNNKKEQVYIYGLSSDLDGMDERSITAYNAVNSFINAAKDDLYAIDLGISKPMESYTNYGHVFAGNIKIVDIFCKSITLSLSQFVITAIRSKGFSYDVVLNSDLTNDKNGQINLVPIDDKFKNYVISFLSIPTTKVMSGLDEKLKVCEEKKYSSDLLFNMISSAILTGEQLEGIETDLSSLIYSYTQTQYENYRAKSLSFIIKSNGIPVVLDNLRFTFDPNSVLDVVATFSLRVFNYKPFMDEFIFNWELYNKYRDSRFLKRWINRTTDPIVAAKLIDFLSSALSNSDLDKIYEYPIDPKNLEFIYKRVKDSYKGVGNVSQNSEYPASEERLEINREKIEYVEDLTTVTIPILTSASSIVEITYSKRFNNVAIPILGERHPVFQHMGTSESFVRIVILTQDESLISNMYAMQNHILNTYRQVDPSLAYSIVAIRNDIINLFDIETVVPANIEISNDTGSDAKVISIEFLASESNKDEKLALFADSLRTIHGAEGLREKLNKSATLNTEVDKFGITDALLYALEQKAKNIGESFYKAFNSTESLRGRATIQEKKTYTDVTSDIFLSELIRWSFPLLAIYTIGLTKYGKDFHESLFSGARKTLDPKVNPFSLRLTGSAIFGLLYKEDNIDGFVSILLENGITLGHFLNNNIDTTKTVKISSYIRDIINKRKLTNREQTSFIKSFIAFGETMLLEPSIESELIAYNVINNINNVMYTVNAFNVPVISSIHEHIVNPCYVDIYPDLDLPTYRELYSNSDLIDVSEIKENEISDFIKYATNLSNEHANKIEQQDNLKQRYTLNFIHIDTDKTKVTVSEMPSGVPNISNYSVCNIFINNKFEVIKELEYPNFTYYFNDAIDQFICRHFEQENKINKEIYRLNHVIFNFKEIEILTIEDISVFLNNILDVYNSGDSKDTGSGYVETPSIRFRKIDEIKNNSINATNRSKYGDDDRLLSQRLSKYIPTYDYYGATPPPLARQDSICKSIDDRVDPGFFLIDPKKYYASSYFTIGTNKDALRKFVSLVDRGETVDMKNSIEIKPGLPSQEMVLDSIKAIIKEANSMETENSKQAGAAKNICYNKVPLNQDILSGKRTDYFEIDPGTSPEYARLVSVETPEFDKFAQYDYQGKTRAQFIFKDGIDHLSSYSRNIIRAYPTAMLWFVEEDSESMFALDDMYQYTAISSIQIYRSKMDCGKAIVTVSNISGNLSRDRFIINNNLVVDKDRIKTPNSKTQINAADMDLITGEYYQDRIKIAPGTKVIIKLGYSSTEEMLPKVFIGRISGIQGGPRLMLDIDGIELQLYRPYSGTWGRIAPRWVVHDQINEMKDYSREIGLNTGLDDGQVVRDAAGDIYRDNKIVTGITSTIVGGGVGAGIALAVGVSLTSAIVWPALIIAGIGTIIGLVSQAYKKERFGIGDTDCTINVYDNKKAWAWGFNWLSPDIDWKNRGEEIYYNLVRLSKYRHNLVCGLRYLDNGGTLYMGPSQGHYVFTRQIPEAHLSLYKSLQTEQTTAENAKIQKLLSYDDRNIFNNRNKSLNIPNKQVVTYGRVNDPNKTIIYSTQIESATHLEKIEKHKKEVTAVAISKSITPIRESDKCSVTNIDIIDGDTFYCDISFEQQSVQTTKKLYIRIKGINTPEVGTEDKEAEYWAEEAKNALKTYLIDAKRVEIYHGDYQIRKNLLCDTYGRYVCKVKIFDNDNKEQDLALLMISEGHALSFNPYDIPFYSDRDYQRYVQAEYNAYESDKGMWAVLKSLTTVNIANSFLGYKKTDSRGYSGKIIEYADKNKISYNNDYTAKQIKKAEEFRFVKLPNMRPFRKIHYINSNTDIIENNIHTSLEEMGNTVRIATSQKHLESNYEDLFELCLSNSIPKNRRIIVPVVDSRFTPGLIASIREMITDEGGQSAMMWAAMNHLADIIKPMYRGSLTIIGNPNIEPQDIVYLYDMHNNMTGKFEVETVSHTYSKENGFITEITPHLLTTINDVEDWQANTITSFGLAFSLIAGFILATGGAIAAPIGIGLTVAAMTTSRVLDMGLLPDFTGQGIFSEQLRNPVMFYPLQYKGIPYVAGTEGIDRVEGWKENFTRRIKRGFITAGAAMSNIEDYAKIVYKDIIVEETARSVIR